MHIHILMRRLHICSSLPKMDWLICHQVLGVEMEVSLVFLTSTGKVVKSCSLL